MLQATGLQLYYVIVDPKVDESYISRKFSKCNSFQIVTDLLNSENLKVAIAQLCKDVTGLQFHYVIADPKVPE